MVAKSCADKRRVSVLVFIPDAGPGAGGPMVHSRNRFPAVALISVNLPGTPSCAWEDEEDLSHISEELYNNYGGLDNEERYGSYDDYEDDFNEEEEEEEDDFDDDYEDDFEEDDDLEDDDFDDDYED